MHKSGKYVCLPGLGGKTESNIIKASYMGSPEEAPENKLLFSGAQEKEQSPFAVAA